MIEFELDLCHPISVTRLAIERGLIARDPKIASVVMLSLREFRVEYGRGGMLCYLYLEAASMRALQSALNYVVPQRVRLRFHWTYAAALADGTLAA